MRLFPFADIKPVILVISALGFLFFGCSSSKNTSAQNFKSEKPVRYSLIYLIHGDANYVYHKNGDRYYADEEALKSALKIGENATSGEVFIFHQKPERKILWLFPKKDREYYHFVNGQLISEGSYSPKNGGFRKESSIYKSASFGLNSRKMLFYFGHEIPNLEDQHYHSSQPQFDLNTSVFSDEISAFSKNFDLVTLSTCNNGSPDMMEELSGKTDFVIASPQNLHLSYFSSDKVNLLEKDPEINTRQIADSLAKDSFEKLASDLQTMVTVGVYNLNQINEYLSELSSIYDRHLQNVSAKPRFTDNIDCETISRMSNTLNSAGVSIYYKPPAFGRKAGQKTHSGWGCKE